MQNMRHKKQKQNKTVSHIHPFNEYIALSPKLISRFLFGKFHFYYYFILNIWSIPIVYNITENIHYQNNCFFLFGVTTATDTNVTHFKE